MVTNYNNLSGLLSLQWSTPQSFLVNTGQSYINFKGILLINTKIMGPKPMEFNWVVKTI